jgi:hypothetical protein
MSSFKPRKVASSALFSNDYREEEKFYHLDPVIQPVVQIQPSGLFKDPTPTILQAYITPTPFQAADALIEANAIAGNAPAVAGLVTEVIEIRSVSILSGLGGNYAIEDDGVQVSPIVAVGAAATGELVNVAIPVAGASAITILAGVAGDTWNLRGVRVS